MCDWGGGVEDLADNPHMDRSHSECVDTYIHLVLDYAVHGLVVGVVRILGTVVLIGHLQLVAQIAPDRLRSLSSMSGLPPETTRCHHRRGGRRRSQSGLPPEHKRVQLRTFSLRRQLLLTLRAAMR